MHTRIVSTKTPKDWIRPWRHGVGDGRGAGGIGDGSEPGLVGEQPAAHAVEQRREDASGGAEQGLVETEGPFEDAPQDLGEPTDVDG